MTDDLPTPPLPEAMASTRVLTGMAVSGEVSRAFHRAFDITSLRSSAVISPHVIVTPVTPGCDATRVSTSFLICVRSGQPLIVSFTSTVTAPSGATATDGTMPRSTMLPPSSGSITPRRRPVTASTVGGPTDRDEAARTSVMRAFYWPVPCKFSLCPFRPRCRDSTS